jgi:hypothetical protein
VFLETSHSKSTLHTFNLFIRLCLQNEGKLSSARRKSHFASLSDDEIARMEAAVRANYCKAGA